MPAPVFVTVASGQTTSGAFFLEAANRAIAVSVPSLNTGNEVRIQFTATSGMAPFRDLQRTDGTGNPYSVYSGTGPAFGIVPRPPTACGRISLPSASTSLTGTNTFGLYTLIRQR